jgi:hypothetical protein
MGKWLVVGVLWLIFGALSASAQGAPTLDTFTSSDGIFQFVYPQTYELLVGERILKATQGRRQAISVCDFLTAIACVIYPIGPEEDMRFEAAGFSAGTVPAVTNESECLTYADQLRREDGDVMQPTSIAINDHVFRHAFNRKRMPGHVQADDFYRTFKNGKCYELRIEISTAEDAPASRPSPSNSPADPAANKARESLRLILSSVVFDRE